MVETHLHTDSRNFIKSRTIQEWETSACDPSTPGSAMFLLAAEAESKCKTWPFGASTGSSLRVTVTHGPDPG